MIDIHTHILPFVDDGSESVSQSIDMLKEACSQGVTEVFLTPHSRGEYNKTSEEVSIVFNEFKNKVKESGINVNLYLGREIHYTKNTIEKLVSSKVLTLANSKFVLVEFDFAHAVDYEELAYKIIRAGYIPIIAHVERYPKMSFDTIEELKAMGALLQVNADSITSKTRMGNGRLIDKLFKCELVDFVASDVHYNRKNCMLEAYKKVKRKYGEATAEVVFNLKAKEIIEG